MFKRLAQRHCTMWDPLVLNWFQNPMNCKNRYWNYKPFPIMNHSHWNYKPTLLSCGAHIVTISQSSANHVVFNILGGWNPIFMAEPFLFLTWTFRNKQELCVMAVVLSNSRSCQTAAWKKTLLKSSVILKVYITLGKFQSPICLGKSKFLLVESRLCLKTVKPKSGG